MIIITTGTPGTGKTELAKALANELNFQYVDVNEVIDNNNLIEEIDEERNTNVVDEQKLAKILVKMIKKEEDLVIDSHLAHHVPSEYVNFCIVTKCDLRILKKRLEDRGYSEEKVRENLDAEIFDICLTEAATFNHNIMVLDTTNTSIQELVKIAKNEINKNK